ncbi:IKBZ inhibitor, partial [Donacobius atricapilla]|nr:IKBZ inhibitor [Donacobius atricapilla]
VTFPDSELSSDPPQKRYMGVRVKMPVRELLRKIRLSKGLDPAPSKVRNLPGHFMPALPPLSPSPPALLLLFQSKASAGQSPRGLEDLDILVEVLQEDLKESQRREEPERPAPHGAWRGLRSPQGRQLGPAGLRPEPSGREFPPSLPGEAAPSFPARQGSVPRPGSPGIFSRTGGKGGSWWMQDAPPSSQGDVEGHLRPAPAPFTCQDLSALSFFQFQLHREESLLRNIPEEKLLAPDENGNRLLHKAVAQGRRALTFALAQRFASLNKIDEKDAEERTALHLAAEKNQHLMVSDLISLGANVNEQDSSGKTPLHLCAENGYLRVLEVLKNCKSNGVRVEVDLRDRCGLTPLHRAALAHTVLVAESQSPAADSGAGRFLALRKDQILEGILCLLQM